MGVICLPAKCQGVPPLEMMGSQLLGVTKGAVSKWELEQSMIAGREYRRRLRTLAMEHLPEVADAFW